MFEYFWGAKDPTGRAALLTPKYLITSVHQASAVHVLLNTVNKPGSMDNDTNWLKDGVYGRSDTAYFAQYYEHDFMVCALCRA